MRRAATSVTPSRFDTNADGRSHRLKSCTLNSFAENKNAPGHTYPVSEKL